MLTGLQILTAALVALAMMPALAHALEFPGKRRLAKNVYVAVHRVYRPGFTLAGITESSAIIATTVLLLLTPRASAAFWLTLFALLCLAVMHAVYWLVTRPVNKIWLEGEQSGASGAGSFAAASERRQSSTRTPGEWMRLRDHWERSHVARAIMASLALIGLLIAVSQPVESGKLLIALIAG